MVRDTALQKKNLKIMRYEGGAAHTNYLLFFFCNFILFMYIEYLSELSNRKLLNWKKISKRLFAHAYETLNLRFYFCSITYTHTIGGGSIIFPSTINDAMHFSLDFTFFFYIPVVFMFHCYLNSTTCWAARMRCIV